MQACSDVRGFSSTYAPTHLSTHAPTHPRTLFRHNPPMLGRRLCFSAVAVVAALALPVAPHGQTAPGTIAARAGFDAARLARIDTLVTDAIAEGKLPGAVVLVGRGDQVVWRKAYGRRAVAPQPEAMTLDTIFDIASLTKVVATTTAVMQLVEDGRLRLADRVTTFIPEFGTHGKDRITVLDLLTHMSGLRPDVDVVADWAGRDTAIRLATEEVPTAPPGTRFVYSDINFFVLAEIVSRVSGQPFQDFTRSRIFAPLGMRDTAFLPATPRVARIAPTQPATLRGVVHDPTARRMGGVAGHAGVFSTADDLARFCRMMLGGGALGSVRVLSPLSVARMTRPSTPATEPNVRGLGWDIDSSYSANRGISSPLVPSGTPASPARPSGSILPAARSSCFSPTAFIQVAPAT